MGKRVKNAKIALIIIITIFFAGNLSGSAQNSSNGQVFAEFLSGRPLAKEVEVAEITDARVAINLVDDTLYVADSHGVAQGGPEQFRQLAAEYDQVYGLCLETTHVNMAITKLAAVFGTGQLEKLVFASVDRSPHCTQMHYMMHEIERTLKTHVPTESYVVSEGRVVRVPEAAVELSKSLARLADICENEQEV